MGIKCLEISKVAKELSRKSADFGLCINRREIALAADKKQEMIGLFDERICWRKFGEIREIHKEVRTVWENNQLKDKMNFSMKLTPDGKHVMTLSKRGQIKLCELETGLIVRYFDTPKNDSGTREGEYFFDGDFNIAFDRAGNFFYVLIDRYNNMVDKKMLRRLAFYKYKSGEVMNISQFGNCSGAFTVDGNMRLIEIDLERKVHDSDRKVVFEDVPLEVEYPQKLEFSDDGRYLLGYDCWSGLVVWDAESGKVIEILDARQSYAFDGKGKIYSCDKKGNLYCYNLKDRSREIIKPKVRAFALALDREKGIMFVSTREEEKDSPSHVSVFRLQTGKELASFVIDGDVRNIELGADGLVVFGVGYDVMKVFGKKK